MFLLFYWRLLLLRLLVLFNSFYWLSNVCYWCVIISFIGLFKFVLLVCVFAYRCELFFILWIGVLFISCSRVLSFLLFLFVCLLIVFNSFYWFSYLWFCVVLCCLLFFCNLFCWSLYFCIGDLLKLRLLYLFNSFYLRLFCYLHTLFYFVYL